MPRTFEEYCLQDLGMPENILKLAKLRVETSHDTLIQILANLYPTIKQNLFEYWAKENSLHYVNLNAMDIYDEITALVKPDLAKKFRIIVIDKVGDTLIIACENPLDKGKLELIKNCLGYQLKAVLAGQRDIDAKLEKIATKASLTVNEIQT